MKLLKICGSIAGVCLGTSGSSPKRTVRDFIEATDGVSPIIGSVLMVAIVVLVLGAFISPIFLPNIGEAGPNAKFVITHDGQETATVTYWNGDTLQANQVTILVAGNQAGSQFSGAIRPGDSQQITAQSGENVQIIWVSSDGTRSSLLGEKTVGTPPGPSGTPTESPTLTATPTPADSTAFEDLNATVTVKDRSGTNELKRVEFTYTLDRTDTVTFEVIDPDTDNIQASDSETAMAGTVVLNGVNEPLPVVLRGSIEGGECYEITVPDGDVDGTTYDLLEDGGICE